MKNKVTSILAAIFATCMIMSSNAQTTTQTQTIAVNTTTVTDGCPGKYRGYLKLTNGVGTYWITAPTGATHGTLSDISGYGVPYVSVACVTRKLDNATWCDTNSIAFPATTGVQYQLTIYVKQQSPTNATSQTVTAQISWY